MAKGKNLTGITKDLLAPARQVFGVWGSTSAVVRKSLELVAALAPELKRRMALDGTNNPVESARRALGAPNASSEADRAVLEAAAKLLVPYLATSTGMALTPSPMPRAATRRRPVFAGQPTPEDVVKLVRELRAKGMGLKPIAAELEKRGIPTPTGKRWWPASIARLLERNAT